MSYGAKMFTVKTSVLLGLILGSSCRENPLILSELSPLVHYPQALKCVQCAVNNQRSKNMIVTPSIGAPSQTHIFQGTDTFSIKEAVVGDSCFGNLCGSQQQETSEHDSLRFSKRHLLTTVLINYSHLNDHTI